MLASQGGVCAACGTDEPGGRGWHTDHSHKSGEVRGVLCGYCNVALGMMQEDATRLRKLADYAQWKC